MDFRSASKKLNRFKKGNEKELEIIKNVRNQHSAHHDLSFAINEINMDVVVEGFIELTNVWYEMCKAFGTIFENSDNEIKNWLKDDYEKEITRIFETSYNIRCDERHNMRAWTL